MQYVFCVLNIHNEEFEEVKDEDAETVDTVRMSTGSLIRAQLSKSDDDTFLFQIG